MTFADCGRLLQGVNGRTKLDFSVSFSRLENVAIVLIRINSPHGYLQFLPDKGRALEVIHEFLPEIRDREWVLQVHNEVSVLLDFVVAPETLNTTHVVSGHHIDNPPSVTLLVDLEGKEVSKEGHGWLDAVPSAYLGKAGQDPMPVRRYLSG